MSECKVGNYVDRKLEVEHRSHRDDGARACDESGTTRPGRWRDTPRQREAQAHERDEVQWTKHAPRSDSQAQQPDLTSRGGVLEECVYEQRPHDMSTTTDTTQPQGLALCSRCHPAWALEAPQRVLARTPRYTGARTTGRPRVARHQRHKWEGQDAMTHQPDSPTHTSSDKQRSERE